eukprot:4404818-Lingulodinium_polyedra.AAC.1
MIITILRMAPSDTGAVTLRAVVQRALGLRNTSGGRWTGMDGPACARRPGRPGRCMHAPPWPARAVRACAALAGQA